MKILVALDDNIARGDGVQTYIKHLNQSLERAGHQVIILSGGGKDSYTFPNTYVLTKNREISFNGNTVTIPRATSRKLLREFLVKHRPDIIHAHMPYSFLYVGRLINEAYKLGIPVVATFHVTPYGPLNDIANKIYGVMINRTTAKIKTVIAVSPTAGANAYKNYGVDKPKIIPILINSEQKKANPKTIKTILYLGRFDARKGTKQFVRAVHHFRELYPDYDINVVMAGDGPERESVESLHKTFNDKLKIKFLGKVSEDQKWQLYADADVAVFPSVGGESFGIVILEALYGGSGAILAGNNPGYHSVLYKVPEFLIDPNDIDTFARRIHKLINQDNYRMIHRLRVVYDRDKILSKILEIYHSAIGFD